MRVSVKLFASLRVGRFKARNFDIPEGTTVLGLLEILKIELREVAIIRVNTQFAPDEYILKEHDLITIFPPMNGG